MSPSAAVAQLLAEALEPLRARLEEVGVTTTIDGSTDRLTGKVVANYTFVFPRELAEKLASKPA